MKLTKNSEKRIHSLSSLYELETLVSELGKRKKEEVISRGGVKLEEMSKGF